MSARTHDARRWKSLTMASLLAAVVIVVAPDVASSQRAGGSIGVSLTVLQPVASHPVEITGFHVNRDGTATLRTTAPTTSRVSQLVMARVSSSASGFVAADQAPVVVRGLDSAERDARELSYRVDVGQPTTSGTARDVQLRIEYLTVAGT
jgi:hypothetical protein